VYIGVGSNLGDRIYFLTEAGRCLLDSPGVKGLQSAPVYETSPVGPSGPGNFLNTVFQLDVCLSPQQLLRIVQHIEVLLGRPRATQAGGVGARIGARTIDLDILLFDDLVFQNDELVVPHPHLHQREFVLRPLADLAPDYMHPELDLSVRELLAALPASEQILGVFADSLSLAHT
jgi:2-amino-4-hydroxy-6-hydroxymethyldihydropteridine diphosphokinase